LLRPDERLRVYDAFVIAAGVLRSCRMPAVN